MRTKMIKMSGGILLALLLLANFTTIAKAVSVKTFPITASVTPISDLNIVLRNISNNALATAIGFGTQDTEVAWGTLAPQYSSVTIKNNTVSWRMRIYSSNFTVAPDTKTWGFQYGGLKGDVNGAKVPMGWKCSKSLLPATTPTGTPEQATTNGWTFLKDELDADDPSTTSTVMVNRFSTANESFEAADAQGYTNIAYGGATTVSIVRPEIEAKSEQLASSKDPFYLYLEADFSSGAAANYTSTLTLELLNQ